MTLTREPRNRLRSADRAVTRQLLIDAAIRVFNDVGYAKATIDRIATEAGASRATFYLHFRTKVDIIPELAQRAGAAFDPHYAELAQVLASGDQETMRAWVVRAMVGWAEVRDLMRPVDEAVSAEPGLGRLVYGEDVPGLTQMQQALAGVIPMNSPRSAVLAEVVFAPLLHFFNRYLRGQAFDHDLVADSIAVAWASVAKSLVAETS